MCVPELSQMEYGYSLDTHSLELQAFGPTKTLKKIKEEEKLSVPQDFDVLLVSQ